ncbi:MAG: hypothetical protein VYE15_04765 [Myxococcota bacterium]|nr:hypothetical protein [Myxococcota bacterium]
MLTPSRFMFLVVLLPALMASPQAHSQEAVATENARPWGGSVLLETSLGRGAFTTDDVMQNTLWNLFLSARPRYTLNEERGWSVSARFDMDMNLMEGWNSGSTRPQQVRPGDVRLATDYERLGAIDALGLTVSGGASVSLPTSYLSQHSGKILGLRIDTGLSWEPVSWMSVGYTAAFGKNLNRFTNATLDTSEFSRAPVSRAGGAEEVAEGLVAAAGGLTSFFVDHALGVSFSFLDDFGASATWELVHSFTYQGFPLDELSSPHASAGRGQADTSYGTLEVTWQPLENLGLAVGSLVAQEPRPLDNTGFRFPLWDMSNGADNRQVFYLDVIGSF